MAGKRSRVADVARERGKKRRKVDAETSGKATSKADTRKPVRVDTLPWASVSLPDKLDDYEGLLDFEEVDDVEILRNAQSGEVTYVTKTSPQVDRGQVATSDAERTDAAEEPEWDGFVDDAIEPASKSNGESSTGAQNETKTKKKASKVVLSKGPKISEISNKQNGTAALVALQQLTVNEEPRTDVSAWRSFKLSPDTLASLARLGFSSPTPIQQAAIPEILALHDVVGKASTGSGKTLTFGIPILERFLENRTAHTHSESQEKSPLALILSPTRELAHQLDKHLKELCSTGLFEGPLIATLTGGLSVHKQQRLLQKADIVIGTPGRLWEVISGGQGIIRSIKKIQFLVVDEADRLLSEGHFKEVEQILDALERVEENEVEFDQLAAPIEPESPFGPECQTLVFSATFDRNLQTKLATRQKVRRAPDSLMNNQESMEYLLSKLPFREESPKFIDVNPVNQLATGLKEGMIECSGLEKDLYLYTILLLNSNLRTLVFTNSISAVRRLAPFLQNLELPALALHSGMPQKARLRSIERFTQAQKFRHGSILVATDVAARGLDIPNVQLVVHYHLPRAADTYVHRSGRTARAGASGTSIILCGPEEAAGVRRLVAKVHAQSALTATDEAKRQGYFIRTVDLDRRIVSRLKPRAKLAKQIADASLAKEKQHHQDDFFRAAAEELGVDYDSEELEKQDTGRRGRGSGRKQKEREARGMTKAEVGGMRAELKLMLRERVNVGVSERYLTSGSVDVDELLRQRELGGGKTGEFLGSIDGIFGFD